MADEGLRPEDAARIADAVESIVYNALQNALDRYVEFVEAIRRYLEAA